MAPEGFVLYETKNIAGNLILYNGQEFATAFVDATNKDKLAESKIKSLLNIAKGMNLLYINGITIGSTVNQVTAHLVSLLKFMILKQLSPLLCAWCFRFSLDNEVLARL